MSWPDPLARLIPALLVCALLAACQPPPQPFRGTTAQNNPLVAPESVSGVLVSPVTGSTRPVAFAENVAAALVRHKVPAFTGFGTPSAHVLHGTVSVTPDPASASRMTLAIRWDLNTADGRALGSHRQEVMVPAEPWFRGDTAILASLAEDAAQALAPALHGTPASASASAPARAPDQQPLLAVRDIVGAPGDGRTSLATALRFALAKNGVKITYGPGNDALILSGTVRVTPGAPGQDNVAITWTVMAPDGRALGTVAQASPVPAGSLSGAWGMTAFDIANAAAPGIERLIRRARTTASR